MFSLARISNKLIKAKCIEINALKCVFYSSRFNQNGPDVVDLSEKFIRKQNPKPEKKTQEQVQLKLTQSAQRLGIPLFTKPDDDTELCKEVFKIKSSKKESEKIQRIMLEGQRLIRDAIESGFLPDSIFFSRVDDLKSLGLSEDTDLNLYKVPYKLIKKWSDVVTSSGLIAFMDTPDIKSNDSKSNLTIVCDNLRDPGNMGTILRTAAAADCRQVILTKGCCDPWMGKVLRSAAGAHFKIPIKKGIELINMIDSESLIVFADNSMSKSNIPLVPYHQIDYTNQEKIYLVIGGETEGIDYDTFEENFSSSSVRVNIPITSESLNSAIAMAILTFEIRRQQQL